MISYYFWTNLTTVVMDQLADVCNGGLKDPVGGWIGDHEGGQVLGVSHGLGLEVVEVDAAVLGHLHWDYSHAGHLGGGWVGAVS